MILLLIAAHLYLSPLAPMPIPVQAAQAEAKPQTEPVDPKAFDFKDPKGVNAVSILMDSTLEPIVGFADGISGAVMFDPAKPEATSGKISVDLSSFKLSNISMTGYALAAEWLDAKLHPTIDFTIKKVDDVKKTGDSVYSLNVTGEFRLRGTSREQKVLLQITNLPGRMTDRMRGGKGDLIALRSKVTIKRSDFGIKPAKSPAEYDVVSDEVQISVAIIGTRKAT